MPFNANAAYSLDFRGNTNFGGSGQIVSPVFDTESAGFSNTFANYVATTTTPTGTSISWAFRSGATTGAISSASWSSSITSQTGRYFQARGTIVKDDVYGASSGAVISDANFYATPQGQAIMIEEAATNLAFYSQQFDNAYWSKSRSSVGANQAIAPDGTFTADKITEDGTAADSHQLYRNTVFTIGQPGSLSVYLKAGTRTKASVSFSPNPAANGVMVNLESGIITSVGTNINNSSIRYVGNGWYHVSCSMNSIISGAEYALVQMLDSSSSNLYNGDSTSYLYIWGIQAEAKAYPTSYVPTTAATATRNADAVSFPSSGLFSDINSGSMIVRFKIDRLGAAGDFHGLVDLGGTGVSGAFFSILTDGTLRLQSGTTLGGSTVAFNATGTIVVGQWNTVGIRWGANNVRMFVNGAINIAHTSYTPNVVAAANIYIGNNAGSSRFLNGLMSDCVIYEDELTDAEMIAYTATGAVIPTDYRSLYALRFENNLLHGEGGYRTSNGIALDNIGAISNSTIAWTETESASASGAIEWNQLTNVTATGTNLQKTGGVTLTWDAESFSKQLFAAGEDGYFTFTTDEINTGKMIGFAANNSALTFNGITHALYPTAGGQLVIYENGTAQGGGGSYGTYLSTDVLGIARKDGVVNYLKNGTSIYTSSLASTGAVCVKTIFYNANGTAKNFAVYHYSKVDLDTSVDNGTTWVAATNGGAISGIGLTGVGKTLKVRQRLVTPRSATPPALSDMTINIFTTAASGQGVTTITPVFTKLALAPTDVTKWQLEAKSYATSFVSGTRNAEVTTIPGTVLNAAAGTIVARVYIDESCVSRNTVQHIIDTTNTTTRLDIYLSGSGKPFYVVKSGGVNYSPITTVGTFNKTVGWNTFALTWNESYASVWANGSMYSSGAIVAPGTSISGSLVYLGRNSGENFNGLYSDVVIYNEVLTNAEIAACTTSGSVIPIDYRTTYSLGFENNLLHGEGGYRTSNGIALDNIGAISNSTIAWTNSSVRTIPETVEWTGLSGMTDTSGTLTKLGGTATVWDSQAIGKTAFYSGENFYVRYTAEFVGTSNRILGLNSVNTTVSFTDMDYALVLSGGTVGVYENSSLKATVTGAIVGDFIRMDVIDNVVKYYKNDTLIYTSLTTPTFPLYIEAGVRDGNAAISGAVFGYYPKVDLDTSVDNGTTWVAATNGGAISGIGLTGAGKTLKVRQRLVTPRSATPPALNDMTINIFTDAASGQGVTTITPVFSKLALAPTDVTKWQLEAKSYATSFVSGTRNAEQLSIPSGGIFTNVNSGSLVARVYLNDLKTGGIQSIFDIASASSSGFLLYRSQTTGKFRLHYGTNTLSTTTVNSLTSPVSGQWYTIGIKWGSFGAAMYLDGAFEASGALIPAISPRSTYLIGSSWSGSVRELDGYVSDLVIYDSILSDAEITAYTATPATNIPLDHRTTYSLRFEDNLAHGEGGYRISPSLALTNVGTISDSVISWNETLGSSGIIDVQTSIDGGTTWSAASNGGGITGLDSNISASGVTLLTRQILTNPNAAGTTGPSIQDITVKIGQTEGASGFTTIRPITTTMAFTPTNLTRWQVEAGRVKTSFMNGSRTGELLAMPSSGVLDNSAGAILCRFYINNEENYGLQPFLFDTRGSAYNNRINVQYDVNNRAAYILAGTAGTIYSGPFAEDRGWHTMAVTWGSGSISVYCDGENVVTAAGSMTSPFTTTMHVGSRTFPDYYFNEPISKFICFREKLTEEEALAYTVASGAVIPNDHRISYRLDFDNNLNHAENGYRTSPVITFDGFSEITDSAISWTETSSTSGTITTQFTVDGGDNWVTLLNGGAITGLVDEDSTLQFKQSFYSNNANGYNPSVSGMTIAFNQTYTGDNDIYIIPLSNEITLTPTNLTKWQLEAGKHSTSYTATSRAAEILSFPTSGIVKSEGGAVVRFMTTYDYTHSDNQHIIDLAGTGASGLVAYISSASGVPVLQYGNGASATSVYGSTEISSGVWHTLGFTWNDTLVYMYLNGSFEASGTIDPVVVQVSTGYVGSLGGSSNFLDGYVAQVNIFGEELTIAELAAHTATGSSGVVLGDKHSYQLKFEDNLNYGCVGVFTSRAHDAGSNTTGTPWVTFSKTDVTPAGTSINYRFGASDSSSTDIADLIFEDEIVDTVGRYMRVKVLLMSDDAGSVSPTVTAIRVIPQYS